MNSFDRQIMLDGPRNAVVKLTGVLDTSDVVVVSAIALQDFTNNDTRQTLVGFRVDEVEFSISDGIQLLLAWDGLSPQQIFALSGRGCIEGERYGGFTPDQTRDGYNGNINLTSTGFVPGSIKNFTVVVELVKLYTA